MEQKLFKELKGEKSNSFSDSYKNTLHDSADIGAYMTKERMASWCRIMQHDADPPSGIFITNSIAVWNHIMDSSPEAQVVGNSIPVKAASKSKKLHENLSEFLDKLQREKWSSADLKPDEFSQNINFNNLISLEIVIIPGQTPTDYFSRFISHPQGEIKQNPYRSAFQNTVLCLLE
jgi:hypothetical protein